MGSACGWSTVRKKSEWALRSAKPLGGLRHGASTSIHSGLVLISGEGTLHILGTEKKLLKSVKGRRNKNDSSGKILIWGPIGITRKRMWLVMEARQSVLTPNPIWRPANH